MPSSPGRIEGETFGALGAGSQVGPYILQARLGHVGMSDVWRAVDQRAGGQVALKMLRRASHDDQDRERMRREFAVLQRLSHPRLAKVVDADTERDCPYLATKYVQADSLDRWVERHGPMSGTDLVRFGSGLFEGIEAIHAADVLHRDMKPGNVLVHHGDPVIIDFGISHLVNDVRITQDNKVMGTPGYVPPELSRHNPVDPCPVTDWWGLIATLAFAASGVPPFGSDDAQLIQNRVLTGNPAFPGADPRLIPLLVEGLRANLADRATPEELVAAWLRYARGGSPADVLRRPHAASPVSGGIPAVPMSPSRLEPVVGSPPAPGTRVDGPPVVLGGAGGWAMPVSHSAGPDTHHQLGGRVNGTAPQPVLPTQPVQAQGGVTHVQHVPASSHTPSALPVPAAVNPAPLGSQGPVMAQPMAAPRSRLRTGSLLGLGVLVVVLCGWAPWYTLMAAFVWSVASRAVDRAITSVVLRRMERGATHSARDVWWAVLGSPWHVLGAVFSSIGAALLPLTVFVAGLLAARLSMFGPQFATLNGGSTTARVLATAMAALVVVAWWGPAGGSLRRGSRHLVRVLSPGVWGPRIFVATVLVAACGVFLYTSSSHFAVSWSPWFNPLNQGQSHETVWTWLLSLLW